MPAESPNVWVIPHPNAPRVGPVSRSVAHPIGQAPPSARASLNNRTSAVRYFRRALMEPLSAYEASVTMRRVTAGRTLVGPGSNLCSLRFRSPRGIRTRTKVKRAADNEEEREESGAAG